MPVTPPAIAGTVSQARRTGSSTTPLTFSHTVTADTDVLILHVSYDDFFGTLPDCTWNGVAVPLLNAHFIQNRPFWYLLRFPTAGTANIVITPTNAGSLAACAINIKNYGGIRFGNWELENFPPTSGTLTLTMYGASTDGNLMSLLSSTSGQVFTTGVGQTMIVAQDGFADSSVKLGVSVMPGAALASGSMTQSDTSGVVTAAMLGIKGLDGAPASAPAAIGIVTNTMTLEMQPNPAGFSLPPPPGQYWTWRHTVPETHPFLVTLFGMFDQGFTTITEVSWIPDGGSPEVLTEHTATANMALWFKSAATPGNGYLQVKMDGRRWFDAGAYSLSTDGILAVATRNSAGTSVTVDSSDGALVIDLIKQHAVQNLTFAPGTDQTTLFEQPIVCANDFIHDLTESGASSWKTATGATTDMSWTMDPTGISQQIAFSFLAVTPPAPVIVEEEIIPRRQRRAPHLSREQLWNFYHQFQLDLQAGMALSIGQGEDPQIMLRWSDDGGHTWSDELWVSAGLRGHYGHRAIWRRLGRSRDRIFEVTVSDPIAWNLLAAYLRVEPGTS